MAIGWNNRMFKYVVRDSFNRADAATSTVGAVILTLVAHVIGVEGSKMLSADEFMRSIQIAVAGFVAIWLIIMFFRTCWWPFHWRLAPRGGLISFLGTRLVTFMWPVVLTASGFLAFVLLVGIGVVWLSLQELNGASTIRPTETPNTVGNPDFALYVPEGRYRFTWPASNLMAFYLRLDTERNPTFTNNPAFILRNLTNTVAYRVTAIWKSETSLDVEKIVKTSPKLSKAQFDIKDYQIAVLGTKDMPFGNFVYPVDQSPKQIISVIAKEEEVYFPLQIWPVTAIYLIDATPDGIGETSPPFIATVFHKLGNIRRETPKALPSEGNCNKCENSLIGDHNH